MSVRVCVASASKRETSFRIIDARLYDAAMSFLFQLLSERKSSSSCGSGAWNPCAIQFVLRLVLCSGVLGGLNVRVTVTK